MRRYPVAVVEFLDTKKPHPVQLMGKDLVAWLDTTTNQWNVFEDACPHRLAPLSEGRIEPDGTLLCAYHAWRFNAKGDCTSIPQARKEKEAELCALPKACAIAHPVQEAHCLTMTQGRAGGRPRMPTTGTHSSAPPQSIGSDHPRSQPHTGTCTL